jgi:GntR family transcriptional regulator
VNSLSVRLELGSNTPIYEQIVGQVREQLAIGELKPGDQLPTVRQLASELRVNFNTIARAYRLLDDAGLISTQRGRGTYLLEHDSRKVEKVVRKMTIEEQLQRTIQSLVRQGYTKDEIDSTFKSIIK